MRLMTIVGARPQFIKAGPLSRAVRAEGSGITEFLVHTGQHYDDDMSRVFFDELALPKPDANLEIGSGTHGAQTARMLEGLERLMLDQSPDVVLVYGDTNSTLAGALAAAKVAIPVAHVEAGLRSFRRDMPEEINRTVTDRVSTLNFCPTDTAVINLRREGIVDGVHQVGDVMLDALQAYRAQADDAAVLAEYGVESGEYYLITLHRAENTGDVAIARGLLDGLACLDRPVLFPVHPRTRAMLESTGPLAAPENIRLLSPVSYLHMLTFQAHAAAILTDSGGMQKEAYCLQTPCLTLRDETEWVETVNDGWNRLVGVDPVRIVSMIDHIRKNPPDVRSQKPHYGHGDAATRICKELRAYAA